MDTGIFKNKKYFVLDMDGTFYLGDSLLEGSLDFISHVKNTGKDFVFFTNNSSKNSDVYVNKLARLGCHVTKEKVITSGMVTIEYLKKTYGSPRILLLGTPMLKDDFRGNGLKLVRENPDVVVAGFDTTVDYEKLNRACKYVREGRPFIATHPDFNCPTEDGFIPDCGAICAFITASTGVKPKILGKPFTETLDFITRYLGCGRDDLVFVGDRLYTDVAVGANHGVSSVLVLTGECKAEDVEGSIVKPDIVCNRLVDLTRYI